MRVKSKRGEGEMTIHELIFGNKSIEEVREEEKRRDEMIRSGKLRTVVNGPCCTGPSPKFEIAVNLPGPSKQQRERIVKEIQGSYRRVIDDMQHTQAVYYMVNRGERHVNR